MPTQARIALREQLVTASATFDEKASGKTKPAEQSNKNNGAPAAPAGGLPVSFNPIVRLEWLTPDKLYVEGDGAFEFQRTVSRLMEMQSPEYLALEHIA